MLPDYKYSIPYSLALLCMILLCEDKILYVRFVVVLSEGPQRDRVNAAAFSGSFQSSSALSA